MFSVIHPPNIGPKSGAKIIAYPNIAIDFARSFFSKFSNIMACPNGKSPPPPKPCINLDKTIISIDFDTAHINDEKVKTIRQIMK